MGYNKFRKWIRYFKFKELRISRSKNENFACKSGEWEDKTIERQLPFTNMEVEKFKYLVLVTQGNREIDDDIGHCIV